MEDQRLFEITTRQTDNLRRNDILKAMESILEAETANFKRYDQDRVDSARSILHQYVFFSYFNPPLHALLQFIW